MRTVSIRVKAIKLMRLSRNLSQLQLAKKSGVSQGLINAVECGKRRLTPECQVKLLTALGASVDDLTMFETFAEEKWAM